MHLKDSEIALLLDELRQIWAQSVEAPAVRSAAVAFAVALCRRHPEHNAAAFLASCGYPEELPRVKQYLSEEKGFSL